METVARCIRRHGWFLRRRDLLARGFDDHDIREALEGHQIFRVRQGWYSVPDAPANAIRAVRVGGRLTGLSALESYGLRVPRRDTLQVAVPVGACRLRNPDDRRVRLFGADDHTDGSARGSADASWRDDVGDDPDAATIGNWVRDGEVRSRGVAAKRGTERGTERGIERGIERRNQRRRGGGRGRGREDRDVQVLWSDDPRTQHGLPLPLPPSAPQLPLLLTDPLSLDHKRSGGESSGSRPSSWRVSLDDALLAVLRHEPRDIAVACAGAIMHHKRWHTHRLDAVFAMAPARARCWRHLVSGLDESHGETFVRLWLLDAGFSFESQPVVVGVGRVDGRVSPNVYIEVDGGQHDPSWTGEGQSSYESDRSRDLAMHALGGRTVRITYRLLYRHWDACLAAIAQAVADDAELRARRLRHPPPMRAFETFRAPRKRRRSAATGRVIGSSPPS